MGVAIRSFCNVCYRKPLNPFFWEPHADRIDHPAQTQDRLKSPFETSFGITRDRTVVLVELLADGITGWSEVTASESPFYNSETGDTAWLIIRGFLVPLILGKEVGSASEIPRSFAAIRGHEMPARGSKMLSGMSRPSKKISRAPDCLAARNRKSNAVSP